MRFYLDEDLSPIIATVGHERFNRDVHTSHRLGMNGATDEEQLAFATAHGWVIVSNNRDHFLALVDRFFQEGRPFSGILITTHLPVDNFVLIARALHLYQQLYPEEDIQGLVDFLPNPGDR